LIVENILGTPEVYEGEDHLERQSMSPTDMETDQKPSSFSLEEAGLTKLEKKGGPKTPWSKVKNIIQTRRGSLKRRTVPGACRLSDDELEEEQQLWRDSSYREHPRKLPVLTLTMPSTEEAVGQHLQFASKGYLTPSPSDCPSRKESFHRKVSAKTCENIV